MKRKLKIRNIIIVILIIFVVILFVCLKGIYDSLKNKTASELVILDTIEKYDYKLDENDSEYYKSVFKELKKNLESDEIDEKKYAIDISKLFTIDYFSLKYAINKNDIGGVQFVYKDYQDDFIKKSKDTVYRYVKNNIYGKRDQELPEVIDATISNEEVKEYSGDKETDSKAYYITVKLTYEKDLEYQDEVNLVLIHSNNKLEIAEMK